MIRCLVMILAVVPLIYQAGTAQISTDAHTVTVQVDPINLLTVNVSSVDLVVDGGFAVPGQDQMIISDQSTTLLWGVNSSAQKITVNTSLAAPLFVLRVAALAPSPGTPAPEATLSTAASDLILDIGRSSGTCQVRYTGEALASQGTGTDTHVITFTVVAQ